MFQISSLCAEESCFNEIFFINKFMESKIKTWPAYNDFDATIDVVTVCQLKGPNVNF